MGTYNYHGYKGGESSAESQGGLTGVESDRGEPCPTCGGCGEIIQPAPMEKWANSELGYVCPDCGGCGYVMTDDPRKDVDCPTCKGETYVKEVLRDDADVYEDVVQRCPYCGGTGRNPLG